MVATRAIGVESCDRATRQTGHLHPTFFLHALPRITLSLVVSKSSEADLLEESKIVHCALCHFASPHV